MKRLMIAAMESGSGKTSVTCALLSLLRRRGCGVQAYKCGPDYIDPMFHSFVTGTPSRTLDLFLQGEQGVRETISRGGADWAILESAMGYYDGIGGTERSSAWEIAALTDTPVLLVVAPKGSALTLAAQIRGLLGFRRPSRIAGLLLNRCSRHLADHLTPILTRETGLRVLGWLPTIADAALSSRHLGLLTVPEIADLRQRIDLLTDALEQNLDLERLTSMAESSTPLPVQPHLPGPHSCRIAVARDEAFCFYYPDALDALERAGAELCFFSPLHDPEPTTAVHGLYLGGGYPELHAKALSRNTALRSWIVQSIRDGMPTVAECGGMLYLQQSLTDPSGTVFPMCGLLPGNGFPTGQLRRFGYLTLTAEEDSLLFRCGETLPAHEFHHWDSTDCGTGLRAEKPWKHSSWRCGFVSPSLYAAFPHLYLNDTLASRFVDAASLWKRSC